MRKEREGKIWYCTQHKTSYQSWTEDRYPMFDTELEVRNFVIKLNTPPPVTTTTVLE